MLVEADLWIMIKTFVKTPSMFVRFAALTFWTEAELRLKCWDLKLATHEVPRELYEKEKYLAVRGNVATILFFNLLLSKAVYLNKFVFDKFY